LYVDYPVGRKGDRNDDRRELESVAGRPVESHNGAAETFSLGPSEGKIYFLNGTFWCTLYF